MNSTTDPNGTTTYYSYDPDNDRLVSVSDQANSSSGSATTVGYGYNTQGYLSAIDTPSSQYRFTYDTYGNATAFTAGDKTIVTNTYAANNGNLQSSTYGNGDVVSYTYDNLDRPSYQKYNGTYRYSWGYNAAGELAGYWDYVSGKTYSFTYDLLGRPERTDVSDGSWLAYDYNTVDQSTAMRYYYGGVGQNVTYAYSDRDNLPLSTTFAGHGKVTNGYDNLGRPSWKKYDLSGSSAEIKEAYTYLDVSGEADRTTGMLEGINYTYTSGQLYQPDLFYTYDAAGNITEERESTGDDPDTLREMIRNGTTDQFDPAGSTSREKYTYDSKGQLIRHDSAPQDASFTYAYDKAGNITEASRYAYTTGTLGAAQSTDSYTYATGAWGDLLLSLNGEAISYDDMGNMTAYNGSAYTWEGRNLAGISRGGNSSSYKYNADGIRTAKTVNGTATEYFLNGDQILAQRAGDTVLWFFYDSQGNRVGLLCGGSFYYYLYNAMGDVVAIADGSTGQIAARYDYDAWGVCAVTNASGATVGDVNPFRYRGYYYDAETGLYYLGSRYYDPAIRRFISADTEDVLTATVDHTNHDKNLFAYCDNNPVTRRDDGGEVWQTIVVSTVVGGIVGAASSIINDVIRGDGISLSSALKGAAVGAINGAISGFLSPYKLKDYVVAAISGVTVFAGTRAAGGSLSDAFFSGVTSGISTYVTSRLGASLPRTESRSVQEAGKGIINFYTSGSVEGLGSTARAIVHSVTKKPSPKTNRANKVRASRAKISKKTTNQRIRNGGGRCSPVRMTV